MQAPTQPPGPSSAPEQVSTPPCGEEPPSGANLQALCSDAVFDSLSEQQLDDMPPHALAQLLRDCAAQRKELKRRLADAEQEAQELRKWKGQRYIVDPPKFDDHPDQGAMMKRVRVVCRKWRPWQQTDPQNNFEGFPTGTGEEPAIVYDSTLQTFKLLSAEEVSAQQPNRRSYSFYRTMLPDALSDVISSALLLYRLHCLFPVEVYDVDRCKSVWETELVHKASGRILGFGEHKGAARVYLLATDPNRQFLEDGIELLNLLCDPHCPHPYDGTVAGCMA